ncbi:hypothetical protein, partial [Klebsiella pneumoniae]|uniref:hypothetical protein n=1 Tax=Klebsiella pneumoniae TaxID=573 RepID=UPI0038546200
MTGELKYEAHYNQSGQLLKDIWHYPVYAQETIGTPGYICRNLNFSGVVNVYGGGPIFGTEYMLYSANKTQDQSVETDYDPNTGTQ